MYRDGGQRGGGPGRGAAGMIPVVLMVLAGILFLNAGGTDGAARAAVNAVLGLAALLAVNWTAGYTGIRLGNNLFNAAVAGVLGVPGVALLILVQGVFA